MRKTMGFNAKIHGIEATLGMADDRTRSNPHIKVQAGAFNKSDQQQILRLDARVRLFAGEFYITQLSADASFRWKERKSYCSREAKHPRIEIIRNQWGVSIMTNTGHCRVAKA